MVQPQHTIKSSSGMKFGAVGQELMMGGNQTRHERDAQNTLNDFKQSFSKISTQQRHQGANPGSAAEPPASMFQTSY